MARDFEKPKRKLWASNIDKVGNIKLNYSGMKTIKTFESFDMNENAGQEETVTISDYMQSRRYNRKLYGRLVDKLKEIVEKHRTKGNIKFPHLRMEISMSAKYQTPYIKIDVSNPENDEQDPNYDRLGGVEFDVFEAIDEVGFTQTDTDERDGTYYIHFSDED